MRRRGAARGKTQPSACAHGDRVDSHPRRIQREQARRRHPHRSGDTCAIGGSSTSPPAVSDRGGSPSGDAPEPDLFLEDVATIQADAGIGNAAAGARCSARCSRDRRSAIGRPTSRGTSASNLGKLPSETAVLHSQKTPLALALVRNED